MLKRKAETMLKEWEKRPRKKALILTGARQVGKTFLIREFGKTNYREMIEINFKENSSASEIFSGDLNVDTMVEAMRFRFPDKKIMPGETLIFLDEIQECSEAVTSLKFWTEDGRYDVIASGSLLGIDYNRPSSYPVGYVEYLKMFGLDFEEFLWAQGIQPVLIDQLRDYRMNGRTIPESIHSTMMQLFRKYIAIGGMPECNQVYVDTQDFREVDLVQRELLQGYQYDIAHYAAAEEKIKAEKCYLSLGKQLLDKENHKFQYKEVEKGGRAQKYYSSIDWLLRADIVELCRLVTDVRFDLEDYAREDFFRAYPTDLSLLMAMRDFSLKQMIVENRLAGSTKGGIYECAVADQLYKKGYSLYFYKNESARREIDFLIQKEGRVVPIEVKSGNNRAASLNALMEKRKDIPLAYKLMDGNIGAPENRCQPLPLYMVGL